MEKQNKYSYLTAIERKKLSFPMFWLKENHLLKGNILDFGCGYGTDIRFLKNENFRIQGYDKYFFPEYPNNKFDTITCLYVLNVLQPIEQSEVLINISQLLKPGGKAFFAVRRDIKYEGYRIHRVHKKPTYQSKVILNFKSIFKNKFCEIYEYQHYNLINHKANTACPFCNPSKELTLLAESATAYALFDKFPVSKGHSLIIPKRHVSNYFDLTLKEQSAINILLSRIKSYITQLYHPDGFNIGVNINESAGQTIPHVHIHLIPRYKNDVPNPIGGVRNVIPSKGDYINNHN